MSTISQWASCNDVRGRIYPLWHTVLSAIAMRLPEEAIEAARVALEKALNREQDGETGQQRKRPGGVLEALRKRHQWGDLTDDEYRQKRAEIEAQVAGLPGDDRRLEAFDRNHEVFGTTAENIEHATPDALQELVGLVVARVVTRSPRAPPATQGSPRLVRFVRHGPNRDYGT